MEDNASFLEKQDWSLHFLRTLTAARRFQTSRPKPCQEASLVRRQLPAPQRGVFSPNPCPLEASSPPGAPTAYLGSVSLPRLCPPHTPQ